MDILKGLNDKQKEAVTTISGPVLIFAGPGSGKTRVLTHRIAYLVGKEKIKPENILAVTFTNKAASEMKQRIFELLRSQNIFFSSVPQISTFHSFCVKVLRSEIEKLGYAGNFIISDDEDALSLVKKIMRDKEISIDKISPRSLLSAISGAKNELIDSDLYQNTANGYYEKLICGIYDSYQKALKLNNTLDFDDLILLTVKIFQEHPQILEKYQKKFRYILIDEYQDTNYAQYVLVNLLAQKYKNIFVVGDDAQGIYGWRGANIRNILEFEKDYPQAKVICLEQNYRSTQNILDAAYSVISKNIERRDKKLWTENRSGFPLVSFEAENEIEEANFVAEEIQKLTSVMDSKQNIKTYKFKDIAVLYRTNAQSRSLEEAFIKQGIPYKIIGGIKFYARKEIKDIIAYLRLAANPSDLLSLERVINIPVRGLGKTVRQKEIFINFGRWRDKSYINYLKEKIGDKKAETLKNFSEMINNFTDFSKNNKLTELIEKIIQDTDYEKYLENSTKDPEARIENVKELLSVSEKFNSEPASRIINEFLEEAALVSGEDEIDSDKDAVNLMTLHSAKGLEFEIVFITGLEEGILPHIKSTRSLSELEEERRLCYVGITRSKEKVYLAFSRSRKFLGTTQSNAPSRFLYEIPEHLIKKI